MSWQKTEGGPCLCCCLGPSLLGTSLIDCNSYEPEACRALLVHIGSSNPRGSLECGCDGETESPVLLSPLAKALQLGSERPELRAHSGFGSPVSRVASAAAYLLNNYTSD